MSQYTHSTSEWKKQQHTTTKWLWLKKEKPKRGSPTGFGSNFPCTWGYRRGFWSTLTRQETRRPRRLPEIICAITVTGSGTDGGQWGLWGVFFEWWKCCLAWLSIVKLGAICFDVFVMGLLFFNFFWCFGVTFLKKTHPKGKWNKSCDVGRFVV